MKLPAFTLPKPIASVGARLPQLPPTLALVGALNLEEKIKKKLRKK